MKKKRILAALLACVMGFGLAACDKKDGDDIPTLKWYMQGEAPQDLAAVVEAANEILVPKIGAKLDMVYIDSASYTQRMNMNMASGDDYDVCFVGYVNPFVNAVQNGGLMAIDKYLENCDELKASLPDFVFKAGQYEGETYAIPNYQIMANASALYVYKDLADEYGLKLDEIETLYDLEPFLEWVKTAHPDIYPFETGQGGGLDGKEKDPTAESPITGVAVTFSDMKAKMEFDVEGTDKEARLMRDWYEKGYIRQDISLVTDQSADEKAGKYACWRATYKPGANEEYAAVRGRDVVSIQISKGTLSSSLARQTMLGVGANSKNPEKAVAFIQEMNTNKDLYNLIAFGIEGKHFDLNEEGKVVYRQNSGYEPGMTWRFGNQFNAYLLADQDDGIWEETMEFNEAADVSPLFGFVVNTDSIKTEVAQISQIYQKYPSRKTGAEPVEKYWETMKSELKAANIEKVVEEVQKQVDEFLATK